MVLPALRSAMKTTTKVLECKECPKQTSSAMQNMMLLSTLLLAMTDSYRKLLQSIDTEAARLKVSGKKKTFRMGDNAPERMHLHTGTPDCPMGFDIELDSDEWRKLARKVVKADIESTPQSLRETVSVLGLTEMLEVRQIRWHQDAHSGQNHLTTGGEKCVQRDGEFSCLTMVKMVRNHVKLLGLWEEQPPADNA
jgi:hypothetical protein